MLRTYSNNITSTASEPIVFNINKFNTSLDILHTSGSGNIIVQTPGYYEVNLDISATGTAGPAVIQLYADGVAIPDAIISTTLVADTDTNSSFNTTIRARAGLPGQTVNLTVVPTVDLTISNISLGIDRKIN